MKCLAATRQLSFNSSEESRHFEGDGGSEGAVEDRSKKGGGGIKVLSTEPTLL